MFKWICLAIALVVVAGLAWMVNDLRSELKQAVHTLNAHLPEMVEKTRKGTDTLAELSEDVRQLKELGGMTAQARDQGLVAYANSVLDFVAASDASIGSPKLVGSGLKDPLPAAEWVVGARKKAVILVAVCRSKKELLGRLCDKVVGTKWYIQKGSAEPVPLLDWIKANHPESKNL